MQLMLAAHSLISNMDSHGSIVHSPTSLNFESPFKNDLPEVGQLPSSTEVSLKHSQEPLRVDVPGPVKKKKMFKNAADSVLKRSASTPNVRSATQVDTSSSMLNAGKRNKLGYHRTSVACVHCRRRKIRCLVAPDDAQNRCANCIRLKKECNFFPVDQQPTPDRRPRADSKAEIKSSGHSSSSSSPEMAVGGNPTEYGDGFGSLHGTPISAHPYAMSFHSNESATFSPPGSAAPFATQFEFPSHRQPWDPRTHYDRSYAPDDHRGGYWPHPETPVSPAYAYPSNSDVLAPSDQIPSQQLYGINRATDGGHPMRSMSYSQVENLAHDTDPYHGHAPIYAQDPHQRHATNTSEIMAPPSLRHSASSSMVSVNEAIPTTYGGAPALPSAQNSTAAYGWGSSGMMHPPQSSKATEYSNNGSTWQYGEQNHGSQHLPKVQEEQEGQPHFVAEPAVLYSNVPHR